MLRTGNYDFCKYVHLFIQEVYLVYNFYGDYIFMKDIIEKQFEIKLGNNGKSRIRSSTSILYIDF